MKDFQRIPREPADKILVRIAGLADEPRPCGSEKLANQERYRVRQGVYRILYEINDGELVVTLIKVSHRKDAHR